jgi:hypothetical protein
VACECGGARAVFRGGRWVECECLRAARRIRAWRRAGIPKRHDSETWSSLRARWSLSSSAALATMARALKTDGPNAPRIELALVGDEEGRALAASLLLRCAVEGGLAGTIVDVPRLVDLHFEREEPGGALDASSTGLAVVRIGGEPRHAYNRIALERLLDARRDAELCTVVVGDDPARAADAMGATRAAEAIRERYSIVSVDRRPA